MNTSIDELERRFYIENRIAERAALLEFEEAWESALDFADEDGPTAEGVSTAGFHSVRTSL